jgi:hypothetical protein
MDTRDTLELWSLVSPPHSFGSEGGVWSQDGVVEVKAWTNGHTGDGYPG